MWILILILLCGTAQANVYVLTNDDKSVIGLSEQNDIFVPSGHSLEIIENKKISDLPVTMGEEQLYDFKGNKFTLNNKRVNARKKLENDAIVEINKNEENKLSAIKKLKDLGLTDNEIKAIIK